jgi:hypothetical protein
MLLAKDGLEMILYGMPNIQFCNMCGYSGCPHDLGHALLNRSKEKGAVNNFCDNGIIKMPIFQDHYPFGEYAAGVVVDRKTKKTIFGEGGRN